MDHSLFRTAAAVAAGLVLTACSAPTTSTETKTGAESKKESAGPAGPVSGKTAFYAMYKPARAWATDLLPLSLASNEVPSVKDEAGKCAMWTAVFVSPSKREARTFSYSIVDHGATIHKGVTMGGAQGWSGATSKSAPFQITEFAVDSDAAYQKASEKAAAWIKKHPDKKLSFYLGKASRFPAPVWYLQWGDTKSGYGVFVNATTGMVTTGK